jgi:hypothetical protein
MNHFRGKDAPYVQGSSKCLVEAKTFSEDKAPSTYTRNILSILYKKVEKSKE